jgi:O-antigen/teichoic acid export membrane protein
MTIRALARFANSDAQEGVAPTQRFARLALRYGLSALGPIAVSGAHFVVSLIFLHALSRADFGLFSFLLVVVPFCWSLSSALLCASLARTITQSPTLREENVATHLKVSLLCAAAGALAVFLLLLATGASFGLAAVLGAYGGVMILRWFARTYAYFMHAPLRSVASDLAYSTLLIAALAALVTTHELTVLRAGGALLGAAVLGLAAFDRDYLSRQFWPGAKGSLAAYRPIWSGLTRWSLMGVVLTEMTANAHAYLVTLISGPTSFALLAVGALLMRPVSLLYAALPDVERPAMGRAIAARDLPRAFQIVKEFRTAIGAMWFATILLAGAILIWFPHLVLKRGYDERQALMVVALYAAIMAVRVLRTPESVLLQAAGEFRALADASLWSSTVSLLATLALLLTVGPIASLGGVLAGEGLMTGNIFALSRRWKRSHV